MKISELSISDLDNRLHRGDLLVHFSPFVVRIRSLIPDITDALSLMYGEFSIKEPGDFADFHIEVAQGAGLRRWIRPQANFKFDGIPSFKPLPANQAYPMLEWGLNWCIASHCHQFLIIHAAVIEKNGKTAIMPAPPGSGKSTLCAGLVNRGWRLLSDELTLVDMKTMLVQPMCRPINLKNKSIEVIQLFQPDAVMTEPVLDTAKGTVALLRPPAESVKRISEPGAPAWIIFPRYLPSELASFKACSKAHSTLRIADESFNYHIHGLDGFTAITALVDFCDCYEFSYSNLDDAADKFCSLASISP